MRLHDVDAVVVSHMHADHFLDLVPFAYALTYAPDGRARESPVRLMVPAGGRDQLRRIVGAWGGEDLIENAFELRSTSAATSLDAGDAAHPHPRRPALPAPHVRDRLSAPSSAADASPTAPTTARPRSSSSSREDTDLLMVEATLRAPRSTARGATSRRARRASTAAGPVRGVSS